jgi:threonine synthase
MRPGVLAKYREFLPITDRTPLITMNEGDTPLIRAHNLARELGVRGELWLKYEGANPTGSFKDRGMVMAVAKALEEGSRAIMCASTGNTSAAAAAFAARVGIEAIVVVPAGGIALGKLAQALIYGAKVLAIEGNFDQALAIVRDLTSRYPVTLVNSINPYRIEGQTTAAYEICDALGRAPDYCVLPVGNAGNITAYWEGYKRYFDAGRISSKPRMFGFEAEGAAAIVRGEPITNPQTVASAIKIGNPASWERAVAARNESEGIIDSVTDEEILDAYRLVAKTEGIFCEPASAASVAGLRKALANGWADPDAVFVCILTGHGLKDPDNAIQQAPNLTNVAAEIGAVEIALGWSP